MAVINKCRANTEHLFINTYFLIWLLYVKMFQALKKEKWQKKMALLLQLLQSRWKWHHVRKPKANTKKLKEIMVNSTERREVIKHEKKDDLNIKAAALSGVKKAEGKSFNVEILRYFNPCRQFADCSCIWWSEWSLPVPKEAELAWQEFTWKNYWRKTRQVALKSFCCVNHRNEGFETERHWKWSALSCDACYNSHYSQYDLYNKLLFIKYL